MSDESLNLSGWVCPAPLRNYPTVVMGHGSGGKMMADLIAHLFAPLIQNDLLNQFGDSTVFDLNGANGTPRLAVSTDSFVISPLFFPGGNIGELAVNGTVNDVAMSGATPLYLSAGFILEEGLPLDDLGRIMTAFGAAAETADVKVIAADTKVVNRGHGDGLFINTTGIGVIPDGVQIGANRARPGDAVLVSGTMGDHGVTIMSVREGLGFESEISSDTASLHGLVADMLAVTKEIHVLRDATRGGLSAVLNELATASGVGIEFEENRVPVNLAVQAACEMLGLDPLYVANEGKLVAILPAEQAEAVLAAMQAHPLGRNAAIIGKVVEAHPRIVLARTGIGATRVVDLPTGELLPRIC
ncbi:MAG: hydrogenase expression/formation protein HypE [Anaerolineaceae bacterium]|nr:hydrogenase expression/formation protein HypE [Anaerolineaceae bacterium]